MFRRKAPDKVLDVVSTAIHGGAAAVNVEGNRPPTELSAISATEPLSVLLTRWCTPGTGVNLWGESPLCMNPVNVAGHGHKH